MRVLQRCMVVAMALVMAASAASTDSGLPDLSTASQLTATGSAKTTASPSNTGSANTPSVTGTGTKSGSTSATSSASGVTITGSGSAAISGAVPTITGTTATDDGALTGLPTLSGVVVAFTVTVPNLSKAPFMQTSTLPDGTVFIVVAAILGFLALCVLFWRALVNWTLHRSVKRAAAIQHMDDKKELFRTPAPPAQFYGYSDRDSTLSLGGLGHKSKKSNRPNTGGAAGASASSLFYSPTANALGAAVGPGNRGSNYFPSGYYATGASAPGDGQGHVQVGGLGHGHAISLSNLRPESHGYGRARSMGHSPPDSPAISAERGHMASSSTLNLNQGYGAGERAPSAYLEDMIDGDNTTPPPPPHGRR